MTRLFVYGTLMSGEPNFRLLAGARLVGTTRTASGFGLVSLGAFPAMVRVSGNGTVVGEIYELGRGMLGACDKLEGHPRFYRREPITLDDGTDAEAYVMPSSRLSGRGTPIRSGDWRVWLAAQVPSDLEGGTS